MVTLSSATRDVVLDTGCNWTEAASKVLKGAKLSRSTRDLLLATGLGQLARAGLDKPKARHNGAQADADKLAAEAVGRFIPYAALVRVFEVGNTHKRFIDCTVDDLELLAASLGKQAAGYTRSAQFVRDASSECQRVKATTVSALPAATLVRLDKNAPW